MLSALYTLIEGCVCLCVSMLWTCTLKSTGTAPLATVNGTVKFIRQTPNIDRYLCITIL